MEKPSSTSEDPSLSKFGLNPETGEPSTPARPSSSSHLFGKFFHNELFHDSQLEDKPFWKANFFVSEPILFGTWDGVYTSCIIHLFGVITLIRAGWIVGNAGILLSICIVLLSLGVASIAVMAGIKIIERVGGGTIHYCLSQVLGARLGGAISIVYCFGGCVNCALHVAGFTESILELTHNYDPWTQRTTSGSVVLILFLINFAGVKWVVRLQFLILAILISAVLDLSVGLFTKQDSDHGILGLSKQNFMDNSHPDNLTNLFSVFGVFFPAVTGVFAGINMSTDLYHPEESIPKGTFTAIGSALFLYLLFMVGLGSTCSRSALLEDNMIAVKVSSLGYLILAAIYISSLSFSLGSMYAIPRIIQDMANEKIIPGIGFLAKGRGPNKLPVYALITYALMTLLFTMIRSVNLLATIVTIPSLMAFAWIEYAHFALSVTTEMQIMRDERFSRHPPSSAASLGKSSSKLTDYGSMVKGSFERLFPTATNKEQSVPTIREKIYIRREQSSPEISDSSLVSPDDHSSVKSSADESTDKSVHETHAAGKESSKSSYCDLNEEWSRAINGVISNRLLSLFGAVLKVVLMFLVHWLYSLVIITVTAALWLYIGSVNPGVRPGVSQTSVFKFFGSKIRRFFRRDYQEVRQFVVTNDPEMDVTASQLTREGTDFAAREKYHQKTTTSSQVGELVDGGSKS